MVSLERKAEQLTAKFTVGEVIEIKVNTLVVFTYTITKTNAVADFSITDQD